MKKFYFSLIPYFLFTMTASAQWSLTGNAVTATNFLGTTNAEAILFKADGTMVGQLQYGSGANVSFGVSAGNAWSAGSSNVAIGASALSVNTASNNTAIGSGSLSSNTTGGFNTSVGSTNMSAVTTGGNNTAVGGSNLDVLTTGSYNCGFGWGTLIKVVSGSGNSAYGTSSLNQNTASDNSAFGYQSLLSNTSGTPNCAFGYQALFSNTTGSHNVAVGNSALTVNITGAENTAVGDNAGPMSDSTALTNSGAFGYGATATCSNCIVLGNTSITHIYGEVTGITMISDGRFKKNIKENVPGLEFIKMLRPVSYTLDIKGMNNLHKVKDVSMVDEEAIAAKEGITYNGFIAQDVESVTGKMGYNFSGLYKPNGGSDTYGLNYTDFIVPLVKAVQELSNKNDSLDNVIDSLKTAQVSLQTQINSLAQQMAALKSSAQLQQNIPNPFKNSTTIHYNLPDGTVNAQLIITDAEGSVLKDVVLNSSKGPGQAVVNVGDLAAGAYFYSLAVNGKIMGTKRMILIK